MSKAYDLLLGLALLHEKNMQQKHATRGWSGVLVQAVDKQVLVEQKCIKEVMSSVQVTRVIDHRDWLVGLLGYEGNIIPLVELRTLIYPDSPSPGLSDRSVLVLSWQNTDFGLLVDKVLGSRDYWSDDASLSLQLPETDASGSAHSKLAFTYGEKPIEVYDSEKLAEMIGLIKAPVTA